jgi:hypothetical protein
LAGKGVKLDTAYIELQIDSSLVDKQVQESLDRAGTHAKDAGTKMGHRMREGIREGMKDVGKEVKDVGKDVADGVRDGLQNASPEFKKSIDDWVQQSCRWGSARRSARRSAAPVSVKRCRTWPPRLRRWPTKSVTP